MLSDVPPGRSKTFLADGKRILVSNVGGEITAFENVCPHMGGSMRYDGRTITCSWHGARFDPKDGLAQFGVAEGTRLKPMAVAVDGDALYYEPAPEARSPWADDF
jgi:nitrite reductase (NADH) small subunit